MDGQTWFMLRVLESARGEGRLRGLARGKYHAQTQRSCAESAGLCLLPGICSWLCLEAREVAPARFWSCLAVVLGDRLSIGRRRS